MTALRKKYGGVRGIVAGEVIRRLTARTRAQLLGLVVEAATAPFQHALSTRAGCTTQFRGVRWSASRPHTFGRMMPQSAIDFGQFRLRPAFFFEFGHFDFGQFRPISGPKFRFFSSLSRIFILLFLSWGSFLGILVVFEAAGP